MVELINDSVAQDSSRFEEWLSAAATKPDSKGALDGVGMHSKAMWQRFYTDTGGKESEPPNNWGGIAFKQAVSTVSRRFGVEMAKNPIRLGGVQARGWRDLALRTPGSYSMDDEQHESPERKADDEKERRAKQDLEDERDRQATAAAI